MISSSKKSRIALYLFFAFSILSVATSFLFGENASAIDTKTIMDKALLQGLYHCYQEGANLDNTGDKPFPKTTEFNNISEFNDESLFYGGKKYDGDYIPVPSGKNAFSIGGSWQTLRCSQVVLGYDDVVGVYTRFGHSLTLSADWLKNYGGYETTTSTVNESRKCVYFTFNLLYTDGNGITHGWDVDPLIEEKGGHRRVNTEIGRNDDSEISRRTSSICATVVNGNITSSISVEAHNDPNNPSVDTNYPDDEFFRHGGFPAKSDTDNECGSAKLICSASTDGGQGWGAISDAISAIGDVDAMADVIKRATENNVVYVAGIKDDRYNGNYTKVKNGGRKWEEFTSDLKNAIANSPAFSHGYDSNSLKPIFYNDIGKMEHGSRSGGYCATKFTGMKTTTAAESSEQSSSFRKTGNSIYTAIGNLLSLKDKSSDAVEKKIALTMAEKISLYEYYLVSKEVYGAEVDCNQPDNKSDEDIVNAGYIPIRWFEDGDKAPKKCYIVKGESGDMKGDGVQGVMDNGWFMIPTESKGTTATYNDIVDFFRNLPEDTKLDKPFNANLENPDGEDVTEDPSCYDNAAGLGVVLCPVISAGTAFFQSFYEDHIVPFLQTNPVLLNSERVAGDSTHHAWSIFQNFANVAFIGIFLVVIFSQVSGVGLDNYGIKKILPKLIIGAILINLSYFICQLAVDVANIAGSGIKGIFSQIGQLNSFKLAANGIGNYDVASAIGGSLGFVAIIVVIGAAAWLTMGPAVLIPIFLAVVVGVIGYIGLFVMLALRTALSVMLVVFSPLAFLCYILPNTKSLFNKWLTAFKAVLLAYPICSIMIYGGEAAGRIMLIAMGAQDATGKGTIGFSEALAAAIMSIGPIFIIPSTLKKSMGALGGVADRLSHATRGRATRAISNSGYSQDLRRRQALHRAGLKVVEDENGNKSLELSRAGARRLGYKKNKVTGKLEERAFRHGGSRYAKARHNREIASAANDWYSSEMNNDYVGQDANENLRRLGSTFNQDQRKKRIEGHEADIRSGEFSLDGGKKINVNNLDDLKDALVQAILKGNDEQAEALQNLLAANGGKGVDKTHDAIREAAAKATSEEGKKNFEKSMGAISSNALNKHGGYKNSDLAMNEMMKQYASGNGGDVNGYDKIDNKRLQDFELSNIAGASKGSLKTMINQMQGMGKDDRDAMAARMRQIREDAKRSGTSLDGAHEQFFDMVDKIQAGTFTKSTGSNDTNSDEYKVSQW